MKCALQKLASPKIKVPWEIDRKSKMNSARNTLWIGNSQSQKMWKENKSKSCPYCQILNLVELRLLYIPFQHNDIDIRNVFHQWFQCSYDLEVVNSRVSGESTFSFWNIFLLLGHSGEISFAVISSCFCCNSADSLKI